MGGHRRSWGTLTALAAVLLLLPSAASAARPNVVTVVTDDQTLESFNEGVMPRTMRALGERGTTFSQAIVSTPQCCPSRAGYLTGQYSQNNGVTANLPGYPLLRDKREILPAWLQGAGYETIHIGKYLNGYFGARGLVPGPGWDRWRTIVGGDYLNGTLSIDGELRFVTERYLTSAFNELGERTVRRQAGERGPFYLQLDHLAPHVGSGVEADPCQGGAIPKAGDAEAFADARAPRNAATRETDLSDKPQYLEATPAPSPSAVAEADRLYRCALGSLAAVDRGISELVSTLRETGQLDETMIIFTSDNGYASLEHRIVNTKGLPYEEHLRVPLVIRPPRDFPREMRSGATLDAPVANVDLAPTILELADARPCRAGKRTCRRMDGRSLLPLLRGAEPDWIDKRAIRTGFSINAPRYGYSCAWEGLRTPARTLVRHTELPSAGSRICEPADDFENYDLERDPFQLQGDLAVSRRLERRLDRLTRCSGIKGRDPSLPGTPFCE